MQIEEILFFSPNGRENKTNKNIKKKVKSETGERGQWTLLGGSSNLSLGTM